MSSIITSKRENHPFRIGVDLGGTKIEAIVLRGYAEVVVRERIATPAQDYAGTVDALVRLIASVREQAGAPANTPIGIGHPGSLSPATGLLRNANSTCLNGQPLKRDLEQALGQPIRMANDADCLAASEAADGAAAGARSTFAAILGTGVGGGIVINGQLLAGPNAVAGEWGHNPLPWPRAEWNEWPAPVCWCDRQGCNEVWLSGTGLAADHHRATGRQWRGTDVAAAAQQGDTGARAALDRYVDRLARGLAAVINLIDPEVIVLGGGVSRIADLYQRVPALWGQWVFSDVVTTRLVPALHGDSSGVFGAARLWSEGE